MGLDMYACTLRHQPDSAVDFNVSDATELHCWRKHPNLHGWMERLYRDKGGAAESFNCVNLQLTSDDIDRLEVDIRATSLPIPTASSSASATDQRSRTTFCSSPRRGRPSLPS